MKSYSAQRHFLVDAMKHEKLSHSYIFSGMNDLAFAQLISKMILCKQEHTGCDSCSSCVKLNSGNHPDLMIIEPDGASIKNAQVEAFQNFMYIRPFESKYKIALFKEAHTMTESAQNRLLKVLEEPPEYAIMIFLTNNIEGVLETVRSRCQIVGFNAEEAESTIPMDILEKAADFVLSLENKDVGRILEFGTYAKQDKQQFIVFLNSVGMLLRDLMVYRETKKKELIHDQNFSILEDRGQLMRSSGRLTKGMLIDLILTIDQVERKIKNNMNFDLTVDSMLFYCIELKEER